MATNDFYYGNRPPSANPSQQQQTGYYGGGYAPSIASTPAPPYSAEPVGASGSRPPQRADTVSPFDTVFDDPAHPTDSTQDGFRHMNHNQNDRASPNPNMNYNNYNAYGTPAPSGPYGQDTSYYGGGGAQSVSPVSSRPPQAHFGGDDIPLQAQSSTAALNQQKDVEINDHVYDAQGAAAGGRGAKKPRKVALGQLGMFGADKQRIPWVCYIFTIAQIATFIGIIVKNANLTGSPIMVKPSFNPMIGPSFYVLINSGARYAPCMHSLPQLQITPTPTWPCPSVTSSERTDPGYQCTLGELCGFGGVPDPNVGEPNQWFRFILPMFLHAGLIHLAINMLVQLTLGKDMERAIGSLRFLLVYVSAGIFGNILGGNFAGSGEASTGASGALFGIIALTLLDLLYSWKDRRNPVKDLMFIFLDIVICFVLGLLPGLDNFAHIGGFLMGLGLGVCVLHSPNSLRRRIGNDASYTTVNADAQQNGIGSFVKSPAGFFKGRKPLWWAWWLVRVAALVAVISVFIALLHNFYTSRNTCSWCKYLSCLPVNGWCEMGELNLETTSN